MAEGLSALSEKEKQTLRLLLAGHDAKSLARHLGLSVHTINERLRDARRKLAVSTSKEAARLLRQAEGATPESFGDERIGRAAIGPGRQQASEPGPPFTANPRKAWAIGGLAMIALSATVLALLASSGTTQDLSPPQEAVAASSPNVATASAQAALQFLAFVDNSNWSASWAATAQSFRTLNSLEAWEAASVDGRVPLGRVLSRRFTGEESIPAPPHGYQLVRFQTRFEYGGESTETLSLAREDGTWKVAGYIIDR